MQIRRSLSNLERLCTFCNKDVNIKKDDYIATQGKDIKISNNKVIIRQNDEKYRKDTIVNFDNVESIEVIYRKEINQ